MERHGFACISPGIRARALGAMIAAVFFIAAPIAPSEFGPAPTQARTAISAEFRIALEPYGRWERHARWGEVWIPANRSRDWRPYTVGRWVYTEEWGWYWVEDQEEANWGWVTFHYGRWISDRRWDGSGSRATNGGPAGCSGGTASNMSDGRRWRRMTSSSNIGSGPTSGSSCATAISYPHRASPG
jgi:hypothetical protein